MSKFLEVANMISRITDESLRGDYQSGDYRKVILPLVVIRRLDAVLEDTKQKVLDKYAEWKGNSDKEIMLNTPQDQFLKGIVAKNTDSVTGVQHSFYNVSPFTFETILNTDNTEELKDNFLHYINGFSENARDIIGHFNFEAQIDKLVKSEILYPTLKRFAEIDLHPNSISNIEMGYVFEELIRRFSENVEAGQHYTPREVIRLMVRLLFDNQLDDLKDDYKIKSILDVTAGTGGLLSESQEYLAQVNPNIKLVPYGQELNEETYAICKADMLLKGQNPDNIKFGNTLSDDKLPDFKADYLIANPPYGDNWNKAKKVVEKEHKEKGMDGRFGPGIPRINDGSLLFLLHMLSKFKPVSEENPNGSRLAIVFSGSPLFTGAAGSGESDIRKYLLENDLVEAIVGLPDQLFYNTGINTYVWVLTNNKEEKRKGKVQLVDATKQYTKMKKSLGQKRHEISDVNMENILKLHNKFIETNESKIFDNDEFGYSRITIEQPLRLNFSFSKERVERLFEQKQFKNLSETEKEEIIDTLSSVGDFVFDNEKDFMGALNDVLDRISFKISSPLNNVIITALSEKDENASIVVDSKKKPKPDTELRDYENVPLKETYDNYFKREVVPHLPGSWMDEANIKIGYEIPFNRHFSEYKPLRDTITIQNLIEKNEKDLLGLMEGLFDEKIR